MPALQKYQIYRCVRYYWCGLTHNVLKECDKAIENLKYALGLNDSGASLHYNLGMAYFAGKKYEDALRELKESLMLEQDLKNIHIIKHYIKIVKIKL